MLSVKRTRERIVLFAALLAVVAIVSGLGVGLLGYLASAETEGARVELAAKTGTDVALQVSVTRADDPTAQDREMRALLARVFSDGGRQIPLTVSRAVSGAAPVVFSAMNADGTQGQATHVTVLSVPDLADRATLVDGAWPKSPSEVSLQADAAAMLGVAVGSAVHIGAGDFTVAGTWHVDNPLDPQWLSQPMFTSGSDEFNPGPVVIDEAAWDATGVKSRGEWTLVPVASKIQSSDLDAILNGWAALPDAVAADKALAASSLDQHGRLARTINDLQQRVDALRSVEPVALLIIAAIALMTLIQLAGLLGAVRTDEVLLLWSRGATAGALGRFATIEAVVVATIGAVIGAGLAAATLYFFVGGAEAVARAGAALWVAPLLTAVVAIVIFGGRALLAAQSVSQREKRDDAGRARRIGASGAVILVTAAAALSVWQLLLYGSPLTPSANGGTQVDPVAVVAPALALLSLVLVALAALPLLAPLAERSATKSVGFTRPIITRSIARGIRLAAAPLVVSALAVGQIVLAAGYAQTWNESYTATTELRSGSSVRLIGSGDLLSPTVIDGVAATKGVTSVAAVTTQVVNVGADEATLVSVTPQALASLGTSGAGIIEPSSLSKDVTAKAPGTVLPQAATGLQLSIATVALRSTPVVTALLTDSLGVPRTATFADDGSGKFTATLPRLPAGEAEGWRLIGFDTSVDPLTGGARPSLTITAISAVGATSSVALAASWIALALETLPYTITPVDADSGVGFYAEQGVRNVRLLPALSKDSDGITPPIVISQALADHQGIVLGDTVPIVLDPRLDPFRCEVAAIVPAIPGAELDAAVLVDGRVLQAVQLRAQRALVAPTQLWVGTDHPAATAADLRHDVPAAVAVDTLAVDPSREILGSASIALWIGAVGAGLLAVGAVAAVVGAQLRSRRGELGVLRALGMRAGQLAATRRTELAVVIGLGIVVGLIAGAIVTVLTVSALARAAVPEPYAALPTAVGVDPVSLCIGLAVFVALMAVVVGIYAAGVARQVRRAGREGQR